MNCFAIDPAKYYAKAKQRLAGGYELTDAWDKRHTMLFELRSGRDPSSRATRLYPGGSHEAKNSSGVGSADYPGFF